MAKTGGGRGECAHDSHLTRDRRSQGRAPFASNNPRVRKAPRAIRVWNSSGSGRSRLAGALRCEPGDQHPVDRRRKKPGPERSSRPINFEALILTPGLTGLRVSGVDFPQAGPSRLTSTRSTHPAGFAPAGALANLGGPVFNQAEVAQFSTGLDTWTVVHHANSALPTWAPSGPLSPTAALA